MRQIKNKTKEKLVLIFGLIFLIGAMFYMIYSSPLRTASKQNNSIVNDQPLLIVEYEHGSNISSVSGENVVTFPDDFIRVNCTIKYTRIGPNLDGCWKLNKRIADNKDYFFYSWTENDSRYLAQSSYFTNNSK